jgi:hypothetical protein
MQRSLHDTQNSKEIKHLCASEIRTHNPASEWPQTYALDCLATGISIYIYIYIQGVSGRIVNILGGGSVDYFK